MNNNAPGIMVALQIALAYGTPVFLLLIGYFVGRYIESRHIAAIMEREAALKLAAPTNIRKVPDRPVRSAFLVTGSAVMASDYFKTFGSKLRNLVGGRMGTLETVVERGRREAILRMREQAAHYGAQAVYAVRLETSSIQRGQGRAGMP